MKFTSLLRCVLAFAGAFLLGSCGGGGATAVIQDSGPLAINPAAATWYAGVVNTITISGGSPPFVLSSSEPSLLPVPINLNGRQVDLLPANPSVIDAGLPPNSLLVRTVNITARSAEGLSATSQIKVGQNFLTGYGISVASSTCQIGSPTPVPLCAGGETVLHFDATTNGNILPNRVMRIERIRGPFQFVDPLNSNNQTDVVNPTSDEEGKFTVIIRAATNFPTQVGIIKVTDTQTGAYVLRTLTFTGIPATGALTILPSTVTLTGTGPNQCGFGDVDVLVFDGQTPFNAVCPNLQIIVKTQNSTSQPGKITFTVVPSGACLTGEQCVITDGTGARATVTFTTVKGAAPATTALAAVPNSITLPCGTTGQVSVVGGTSTSYSAASTHQRVIASVQGNTVTITRLAQDALAPPVPPPPGYPATATVSVTDGNSAVPITVNITGMVGGLCP